MLRINYGFILCNVQAPCLTDRPTQTCQPVTPRAQPQQGNKFNSLNTSKQYHGQHGDAVISIVMSQQEGSWFESPVWLGPLFCVDFISCEPLRCLICFLCISLGKKSLIIFC